MAENEYRKMIARNLKRLAYESGKTQADISKDLHINKGTVSTWMNGNRIPRMDKVDLLCSYFNCKRADIMEENPEPTQKSISLDSSEMELIMKYRLLNQSGREKVLEYTADLSFNPAYSKSMLSVTG